MQLHLNSYNHAISGLPDSLFFQRLKLWDIFVKSEKHGNLSVNSKHFSLNVLWRIKWSCSSKTFFCWCKQYPGNLKKQGPCFVTKIEMELLKLQQTWFTSQSLEPLPGNPIYRNLQIDKRAKKLILNYVCSNTSDFVVFGCAGLCSLRPSPQCGSYIYCNTT